MMKSDFVTYICRTFVKQKGLNIIAAICICACIYRIDKLNAEVKALKSETEGESA